MGRLQAVSWATEQATDFLPPSPAKDLEAYDRFVRQLVQHCAGRVHYWQCDNEPSNVGLTWAGTADSYLAQLRVMHRVVKEIDPNGTRCPVIDDCLHWRDHWFA
jgi:hypothetical protein